MNSRPVGAPTAGNFRLEEEAVPFVLHDLPAGIAASKPYLLGMAAALGAAFEMMDVEGEAVLGDVDVAARSAEIRVAWK